MLDLNLIRENPDLVRTALSNRQMDASPVDEILRLDERRRALLTQVEALKAERNAVSKEIGRSKDAAEREKKIASMREVGDKISALDKEVADVEADPTFDRANAGNHIGRCNPQDAFGDLVHGEA